MPPEAQTHVPFFLRVVTIGGMPTQGVVFILEQKTDDYSWEYVQTISSDENGWVAFLPLSSLGTYRIINYYAPYPYSAVSGYHQFEMDYYGIPLRGQPPEPLPIQPGRYTYLTYTVTRTIYMSCQCRRGWLRRRH